MWHANHPSNSNSSPEIVIEDLNNSLILSSTLGRVRRLLSITPQEPSQVLDRVLARQQSLRLAEARRDLLESPEPVVRRSSSPKPGSVATLEHYIPPSISPTPSIGDNPTYPHCPLLQEVPVISHTSLVPVVLEDEVFQSPSSSISPPSRPSSPSPSEPSLNPRGPLSLAKSVPGSLLSSSTTTKMEEEEKSCRNLVRKVNRTMRMFTAENLDETFLTNDEYKTKLNSIESMSVELSEKIEEMIDNYRMELGDTKVKEWEGQMQKTETDVISYGKEIRTKVLTFGKPVVDPPTSVDDNLQNNQPRSVNFRLPNNDEAIKKAKVKVKNLLEIVEEDAVNLIAEIRKVKDWGYAEDHEIAEAMRKLDGWKKTFKKIKDQSREAKELTDLHDLDPSNSNKVREHIDETKAVLDVALDAIEHEDGASGRCLFTNDSTRPANVKFPKYSGDPNDDFTKFQKEMQKAFLQNRVTRSDQVAKLRESLSGHAKQLIPNTMEDINAAWDVLGAAFGDPARVMKARKDKIISLGSYPPAGRGAVALKKQVEWLMSMELVLEDIVELGCRSLDMDREAFSGWTISRILSLFPLTIQADLSVVKGDGKQRVIGIINELKNLRGERQDLLKNAELIEGFDNLNINNRFGKGNLPGKSDSTGGSERQSKPINITGMTVFKNPQRDEKCRICVVLDTKGDTKDLYDKHRANDPTGCPRFAAATTDERKALTSEARMCYKCLDPDFVIVGRGAKSGAYTAPAHPDCKVQGQQTSTYTCRSQARKCKLHMWICTEHKEENKPHMEIFKAQWIKKGGGKFSCMSVTANTPDRRMETITSNDASKDVVATDLNDKLEDTSYDKVATDVDFDEHADQPGKMQNSLYPTAKDGSSSPTSMSPASNSVSTPTNYSISSQLTLESDSYPAASSAAHSEACSTPSLAEATESLRVAAGGVPVLDVPDGEPMFMFSYAIGKTRPLNVFYDRGCSHVCFKRGVPVNQLNAVMTRPGPIFVNGVGDTHVEMNAEYVALLDKRDGTKQAMLGIESLGPITSTFPMVSLAAALQELKGTDPDNVELQELKAPEMVGGEVDILLGIHYECVHPIPIHRLSSGLTIFKLVLSSHLDLHTAVIGGPHDTFRQLADQAGNPSVLLTHFVQGLVQYEQLGPPKIPHIAMTEDDIKMASSHNERELKMIGGPVIPEPDDNENDEEFEVCTRYDHILIPEDQPVDNVDHNAKRKLVSCTRADLLSCDLDLVNINNNGHDQDNAAENVPGNVVNDIEAVDGIGAVVQDIETCMKLSCSLCGEDCSASSFSLFEMFSAALTTTEIRDFAAVNSVDKDDPLSTLKLLAKLHEDGISIEYRCPKCRHCSDCRNAPETERVSLREEAEDVAIKESVKVNWNKKKIICTLPLRGKEEEFLTGNRDIAERILNQQCSKYKNDEQTKKTVVKAFQKLFDNNYACLFSDLTEVQKRKIILKPVQHYIPWRVVFKASISTPCRPVMDASTRTKLREDGSGGRCLNDLVMKGKVVTLNLLRMIMRFQVGKVAAAGDLKQFYTSIGLNEDQWNLQRCLWKDNLDSSNDTLEVVIKTLIFGVRSVSAQSEAAMVMLANHVKATNPLLAEFLINSRYVDDLADSEVSMDVIKMLTTEADKLFGLVGLSCKGWSYSGQDPCPDTTEDGETVGVAGMGWSTKIDTLEVKIPPLHFGKKSRGRLVIGTEIFDGEIQDLDAFVPKTLTRRMVFSKYGALWDILGKLTPITASMKQLLRKTVTATEGWDDEMPETLRSSWLREFWRLEQLKGLRFQRARMPSDAVDAKMRMIAAADAADCLKIVGVWVGFRRQDGSFSCQLLIGRSLLSKEDSTIPKEELDALTAGSNLLWISRLALDHWVSDYVLLSDSVISICWASTDKKRLSLFHRNRTVQIRRGTDLDKVFHVVSKENPCDTGTRPEKINVNDVGPNSTWELGMPWMTREIQEAVDEGILTPSKDLKVKDGEKDEFEKGLVFEQSPEILVRGHVATNKAKSRIDLVASRAIFSNYIILPTKFPFRKTVKIIGIVMKFLKGFKCLALRWAKKEPKHSFQMFNVTNLLREADCQIEKKPLTDHFLSEGWNVNVSWGSKDPLRKFRGDVHVVLTDSELSQSLEHLFTIATNEIKEFCKKESINKEAIEKDGILFCRSRLLDGQRLIITAGMEDRNLLHPSDLNLMTPMVDRYSPLAYSIATHVHDVVCRHAGYETCHRMSLTLCHIRQGASLYREIGEECVGCGLRRKKYLEVAMGPVSDNQLTVAPPFWLCMADLYGPIQTFVPGHERVTRSRGVITAHVYIMVFVCPTTKLLNLQVIESKSVDGIADGLTRLGCEVGFPTHFLVDQDAAIMKVMKEAEVDIKDLQHIIKTENGINFTTCPVTGHYMHGLVERRIKTVEECLKAAKMFEERLHATGVQTVAKLIENELNNLPFGFSYGRDVDNSPLLRLLTPNLLKLGRLHSRALVGPVRLPSGPGDLMKRVEDAFDAFFNVWNVTMIPRLIKSPKWYKSDEDLRPTDIVYFKKVENELSSDWTLGQIDSVEKGKDGKVRQVVIRYQNCNENLPRYTHRPARKVVRLFNVEDTSWMDDMAEVEKIVAELAKTGSGDTGLAVAKRIDDEIIANQVDVIPDKDSNLTVSVAKSPSLPSGLFRGLSWASGSYPLAFRPAEANYQVDISEMFRNSGLKSAPILGTRTRARSMTPTRGRDRDCVRHLPPRPPTDEDDNQHVHPLPRWRATPPPPRPTGLNCPTLRSRSTSVSRCDCCCVSHHRFMSHSRYSTVPAISMPVISPQAHTLRCQEVDLLDDDEVAPWDVPSNVCLEEVIQVTDVDFDLT